MSLDVVLFSVCGGVCVTTETVVWDQIQRSV
uniref:Uncharacterized protein n=1 Tax=Anguilla anguilla TaxID=7936 RepID=A0A0E9RAQ9_ANGAN